MQNTLWEALSAQSTGACLVQLLFPCVGKNFIRIVLADKEKPNLITAFPVPPLPSIIV